MSSWTLKESYILQLCPKNFPNQEQDRKLWKKRNEIIAKVLTRVKSAGNVSELGKEKHTKYLVENHRRVLALTPTTFSDLKGVFRAGKNIQGMAEEQFQREKDTADLEAENWVAGVEDKIEEALQLYAPVSENTVVQASSDSPSASGLSEASPQHHMAKKKVAPTHEKATFAKMTTTPAASGKKKPTSTPAPRSQNRSPSRSQSSKRRKSHRESGIISKPTSVNTPGSHLTPMTNSNSQSQKRGQQQSSSDHQGVPTASQNEQLPSGQEQSDNTSSGMSNWRSGSTDRDILHDPLTYKEGIEEIDNFDWNKYRQETPEFREIFTSEREKQAALYTTIEEYNSIPL